MFGREAGNVLRQILVKFSLIMVVGGIRWRRENLYIARREIKGAKQQIENIYFIDSIYVFTVFA